MYPSRKKVVGRGIFCGKVVAVCLSKDKGTAKENVHVGFLRENFGLVGDVHADEFTLRQVSLLAIESINKVRHEGFEVNFGDFAENITTEQIDLSTLHVGAQLLIGQEAILEITQIGKDCHSKCSIYRKIGKCIMPKEGVFAKVVRSGWISVGDSIKVIG